ncbi:MAG: phosphatidate cytidylyltransferase [Rhodobacteraceae bacterium]|nr:phosphatidate cytidylyltransferase [Paracoccaceae bacterium]
MNGQWSDLAPRLASAVVMVVVGFGAIWVGGLVFNILVALACGAMVWELSRMIDPKGASKALQMGSMTSAMILICAYISPFYILPFLLAPGLTGAARMPRMHGVYLGFAFVIALAGISLISVRGNLGFDWILWLICVVVVTDVAGYFAGKALGGPKLWPRVSPKKTWSGTLAGWVGAGVVGALFSTTLAGAGTVLILISVLMSMASQAGDIAESALKRRTGVKDSSALIPGHGGVMDRFDGMLGAALFVLLVAALFGFPAGLI